MTNVLRRALPILAGACAAGMALAHPGHEAPPVHAHDLDEVLVMAAVILGAAVMGLAIYAVRRARSKGR